MSYEEQVDEDDILNQVVDDIANGERDNIAKALAYLLDDSGTRILPPTMSGPLSDAQYVELMVRPYEGSLDWTVRSIVTSNRVSMQSLDIMLSRNMGNQRRWVAGWFKYWLLLVKEPYTKLGALKRDKEGRPVPKIGPDGEIKRDQHGGIDYERENSVVKWGLFQKKRWIKPEQLEKLRRELTKERREKLYAAVERLLESKVERKDLTKEQAAEELKRVSKRLEEASDLFSGMIAAGLAQEVRKHFLSPLNVQRSLIGPREHFTKTPTRLMRLRVKGLLRLQRVRPDTGVVDFYEGRYPEKWLARNLWSDPGQPELRLGSLNLREVSKLAEYQIDPRFYLAEKRWKSYQRERRWIIREYGESHKDSEGRPLPIPDGKLEDEIEHSEKWWTQKAQYDFVRKIIPNELRFDKNPSSRVGEENADIERTITAAEQADACIAAVDFISYVIRPPRFYVDSQGDERADWSDALIYFPINEEIRDLARMVGHFQQCKSQQWKYAKFTYSTSDVNGALDRDHGGARSAQKFRDCPTFMICWEELEELREGLEEQEGQTPADELKELWKAWRQYKRELLGPVVSMTPDSTMPAATAWYGEFGERRVDMTNGAKTERGSISQAREGYVLKWRTNEKIVQDLLPGLRRYTGGEVDLLEQETYFWDDPWDITKNNGGLGSDGLQNALMNRMGIYTRDDGVPMIEIVNLTEMKRRLGHDHPDVLAVIGVSSRVVPVDEPIKIDFFNQREIYKQLALKQTYCDHPRRELLERLELKYQDLRAEGEFYIWEHIEEMIKDIAHPALMEIADELDGLHERCDFWVNLDMADKARGKSGGVRAWSSSDKGKADRSKFGVRLNRIKDPEVFKESHRARTRLGDMIWRCQKFDQKMGFVRSQVRIAESKRDVNSLWNSAQSELKALLPPDMLLSAMYMISQSWSHGSVGGLKDWGKKGITEINWGDFLIQETADAEKVLELEFDELVENYAGAWTLSVIREERMIEALMTDTRL